MSAQSVLPGLPPRMRPWRTAALLVAVLSLGAATAVAEEVCIEVGRSKLYVRPPDGFQAQDSGAEDCRLHHVGTIEGSQVSVDVWVYSQQKFPIKDPEHLAKNIEHNERINASAPKFTWTSSSAIGGPYGIGGYAMLCTGETPDAATKTGEVIALAACLDEHSYYVHVVATPALPDPARRDFIAWLRSAVRAETPGMDPKWTDAEVEARWAIAARDANVRKQLKAPVRTAHYIVLTNSPAGAKFAAQMERTYAAVERLLPDDVGASQRLLPLLLFAKADQYYAYYVAASGRPVDVAKATGGVALDDTYATWDGVKDDGAHVRGAMAQYLRTRLRLDGGGWWLRQGLGHYLVMKPSDLRTAAATMARQRTYLALERLFVHTGTDAAAEAPLYVQAASVVGFLKEGPLAPGKFMAFVRRVGADPAPDTAKIEAILKDLYDLDIAGLEKAWLEHWSRS